MIIKNFSKLAKGHKKIAMSILNAGMDAALPELYIQKILQPNKINLGKKSILLSKYENIHIISFGKAADSMTKAVDSVLHVKSGIIVIPKSLKSTIKNKKFKIIRSNHPTPNSSSIFAANEILKFLQRIPTNDFIIFLVSGGASSLLSLPNGISIQEKANITNFLLKFGAKIDELNCVRKHLSKIKGGQLVEKLPCDGISLVLSDVIENDLSSIASGTTYCDKTTFSDALKVLKKYKIRKKIFPKIFEILEKGASGKIAETPKKPKILHYIIASNIDCLKAMLHKSRQLGLGTKIICISGDVKNATNKLILKLPKNNFVLIFGGETTVNVKGKGKGGRNQELVLRLLEKLSSIRKDFVIASMGTDGIDGNTKFAGAITCNTNVKKSIIKSFLANNDSNSFFKKYGELIRTGYTNTNLMDIGLIHV